MFDSIIEAIKAGVPIQSFEVPGPNGTIQTVYNKNLYTPPEPSAITTITSQSLSGLLQFIDNADPEIYNFEFIHVVGPGRVELQSIPQGFNQERTTYYQCLYPASGVKLFEFGSYQSLEDFVPQLLSRFVQDSELKDLAEFISSVSISDSIEHIDNGMSQSVVVKSGLAKLSHAQFPNQLNLMPCRTFCEISQPPSSMILRTRKSGDTILMALLLTDNGNWQKLACDYIATYLQESLAALGKDIPVIL